MSFLPILSSIPVVILAGIFETPHTNPLLVQIVAFILSSSGIIMVEGFDGYSWFAILYLPDNRIAQSVACYFSDCPSL